MRKITLLFLFFTSLSFSTSAQCDTGSTELFISVSGGGFASERWVSITTGENGSGDVIFAQGDGTYGNGSGNISMMPFCVENGVTYYINAYDSADDSWGPGRYSITDASGTVIVNNNDVSPDDGNDEDSSDSFGDTQEQELEVSEAFAFNAATCVTPANLLVNDISQTTAVLSWSTEDTATQGYDWVVVRIGDDPENDTAVSFGTTNTAAANTAMATGLSAARTYDAYVRSNCDNGERSEYSLMFRFTTPCATETPEYLESFDNVVPPECWLIASDGLPSEGPREFTQSLWVGDDYLNDESASNGVNNSAKINLDATGKQEWLISPPINLSADDYELVFKVGIKEFDTEASSNMGSDDEVRVLALENGSTTWQTLQTFNADNQPSANGKEVIIDLTAFSSDVTFALWASDGTVDDVEDYDFFVDQFQIRTPLTCTEPEASYTIVPDCDNEQFSIEVMVSDLGSASSVTVSDDFDNSETIMMAGTVTIGPYNDASFITFNVTNDQDNRCQLTFSDTFICPPINDLCDDALALTLGTDDSRNPVMTTNEAATDSMEATPTNCSAFSDSANYDGGDVWFSIVVPDDGVVTIETSRITQSSVFDTSMAVYTGSCGALTQIACDDDGGEDFYSRVEVADQDLAGQTLLVRTWVPSNTSRGAYNVAAYNPNALSTEDFENDKSIVLYPNPASNVLNISGLKGNASIRVYNLFGQTVMVSKDSTRLDVSNLSSGMYVLVAEEDGKQLVKRFVRE